MYIPDHFRERHHADTIAFMQANPFAIVISASPEGPFATHAPLSIHAGGDRVVLRGHVAKANPHWKYLEQNPQCLTIFHGAHAYISPSNYVIHESVPTWNYGAVHVYGEARLFSSPEELLPMLHELIGTFEASYAERWATFSEEYRHRMLSHIVGFEILASRVEGKFKLSQNRTKQEQANVISSLESASDSTVSGVAQMMRHQGLGNKE